MRPVSKSLLSLIGLAVVLFAIVLGLTTTASRADAAETRVEAQVEAKVEMRSSSRTLNMELSAPAVNLSSAPQLPASLEASQATGRLAGGGDSNCDKTVGAVPFIGGKICTGVDAFIGGAGKVIDFMAHPFDALAEWAGKIIGKGVGWAGEGVINLAIGIHEDCEVENINSNADNKACTDRLQQDYFAPSSSSSKVGSATADDFYVPKAAISSDAFNVRYTKYITIAIMIMIPMLIAGALQAVVTGKPVVMLRSVFLHLPLAFFGIALTPYLVRLTMVIIDAFSAYVMGDVGNDIAGFFTNPRVMEAITASAIVSLVPLIFVALVFLFACMLLWFILSMREGAIALLTMFMPIAFAAAIWPALGKWAIRGIKLIMAAVISKVFIVGAVSLGIGVFSGATGGSTSGTGGALSGLSGATAAASSDATFSFSHLIYGATIFFIASFSPHLVMKFFDEIGEALNAAGGTGAVSRGLGVTGNLNGTKALLSGAGGLGGGGTGGSLGSSGDLAKALGGAEGGKALAGGASLKDAAKTAATVTKAAGGGSAEVGSAVSDTMKAGGMKGNSAAAVGGGHAADQARAGGASPGQAGEQAGIGAAAGGADATTAGQVAYGETLAAGGSKDEALSAQNSVTSQVAANEQRAAQNQKLDAKAHKKQAKHQKGNAPVRFLKATSPIHLATHRGKI